MPTRAGRLTPKFLSTPSARRATFGRASLRFTTAYFYPRPPRGGRHVPLTQTPRFALFLSTPSARRATYSYKMIKIPFLFLSTPSARRATVSREILYDFNSISIHALREEGDGSLCSDADHIQEFLSTPSARRATAGLHHCPQIRGFLSTPSARRATDVSVVQLSLEDISIHALREEGDSKNGEKHLRFCFIIKRSAQIWKSLSKNIRKNSCDLHRTA